MTTTEKIILAFYCIAAFVTIFFSRICLRKHPRVSSAEITKLNPNLSHARFIYGAGYLALFFGFLIVFSAVSSVIKRADFHVSILFIPAVSSLALYEGFFALITGVYPVTDKYHCDDYVYDQDRNLRWVALSQIGLAIVLIIASIVIFVFYQG